MRKSFFEDENYARKDTNQKIMSLKMPSYRKAYSDRTAYLMACLSELSYVEWEKVSNAIQSLVFKQVKEVIAGFDEEKNKSVLLTELTELAENSTDVKKSLIDDIAEFNLHIDVEHSFVSYHGEGVDTQALLMYNDEFSVLAFRGTQAKSVNDIRTDVDGKLVKCNASEVGRVHSGFQRAFTPVRETIINALQSDNFKGKPLFITGHSLGGALATVATRSLKLPIEIAACYTFGSPRVGDEDWINQVKSPVYRLVNAADAVTMLPPNSVAISGLSAFFEILPIIGKHLNNWLKQIDGYLHTGNMRYLTNCPDGNYQEVKILYSVSFFYRIKAMWTHSILRRFAADHSINVYRRKLEQVVLSRNGNNS